MTWGMVAVGAVSLIGGAISSNAAKQAAKGAGGAADRANATQWAMYQQTRDDQEPWRIQGGQAVNMLGAGFKPGGEFDHQFGMGDYQADPGYQFRLDQGNKALDRAGARAGNSLSGAQFKGIADYNSGMASQEYGNAYNRFMNNRTTRFGELSNIAGLGQSSVGQTGQLGANTANQVGQNTIGAANMQGAAGIASANAWSGAINTGVNTWQDMNMMKYLKGK